MSVAVGLWAGWCAACFATVGYGYDVGLQHHLRVPSEKLDHRYKRRYKWPRCGDEKPFKING